MIKQYIKEAEQGNAAAQYNIALCYYNGQGVEKDINMAKKWIKKAAEQGYEKAKCFLENME